MSYKYLFETPLLLSGLAMSGIVTTVARGSDLVPAASSVPSIASTRGPASVHALGSGVNPCRRWEVVRNPAHPEWPGHYVETPAVCLEGRASGQEGVVSRSLTLRAGERTLLRSSLHNSLTLIAAVALQDGAAGEVIRLRSALGNAVLWGLIQPDGSTELTLHATSQQAIPAGQKQANDPASRY